jgi:P-type Ca2+ transporter type 2C
MIPFSSDRKAMGVVVRLPHGAGYRLYLKGASEISTGKCTRHVVVKKDGSYSNELETAEIDDLAKDNIQRTTIFYANQMLRTIALCYKDMDVWPSRGCDPSLEEVSKAPLGFGFRTRDSPVIGPL